MFTYPQIREFFLAYLSVEVHFAFGSSAKTYLVRYMVASEIHTNNPSIITTFQLVVVRRCDQAAKTIANQVLINHP